MSNAVSVPESLVDTREVDRQAKVREPWIDWIRVWAAIGIVVLHVMAREKVRLSGQLSDIQWWTLAGYETLTRIAVPLFFLISGYLVLEKCQGGRAGDYAWRRAARLLALALWWTLVFSTWEMLKENNDSLFGFFVNALNGRPYYHLWFLFAIVGAYVLAPVLSPGLSGFRGGSATALGWCLPLAVSLDYLIFQVQQQDNFYRTSMLSICVPYLAYSCAGYLLVRGKSLSLPCSVATCMFGAGACLASFAVLASLGVPDADRIVYFPLSPFVVVMSLGAYSACIAGRKYAPPLPRIAGRFARDSMGIYILHPFALDIVNHFGLVGRRPNSLVGVAFTSLVVVAATWTAVVVCKRFYLTRLTVSL